MKITYILGNGFDIQMGLDTRYSDFLKKYTKELPSDSENIKNFKKYLSEEEIKALWSAAERAMGIHLGKFSDESLAAYHERVLDFEVKMATYLEGQEKRCSYGNTGAIKQRFTDFLVRSFGDVLGRRGSEMGVNGQSTNVYRFISFNYTNILEQIRRCFASGNYAIQNRSVGNTTYTDTFGQIYHIHGTLSTQIIMGVNDESQLDLSGGVSLTEDLKWELIKPSINSESRHYWDVEAKKVIADSDLIVIYGVSYGETDNLWWAEIREWMRAKQTRRLLAFVRRKEQPFDVRIPWAEMNFDKQERIEILGKLGFELDDPDFPQLMNQVYLVLNTSRLNLKEIILQEDADNEESA